MDDVFFLMYDFISLFHRETQNPVRFIESASLFPMNNAILLVD